MLERAGLITRGRDAQWRPCTLDATPLREVTEWADGFRRFWDDSHRRLDTYLERMKEQRPLTTDTTVSWTTPSPVEVAMTRTFDAPQKLVFEAFTRPAHVVHWMLGPEGWTMPVCEIDLRPGGRWHMVWRRDDGSEMAMSGEYQEVTPWSRTVQTESWGAQWASTVNTTEFIADGDRAPPRLGLHSTTTTA